MEAKSFQPYIVLILTMLMAALALAYTVDVKVTDEAGIKVALPDRVGAWTGYEMRFCQNPICRKEFSSDEFRDRNVCPACGNALDCMVIEEKEMLPPDTSILKKKYVHADGPTLYTSIVLSGKERASIHRPQVCLVGQGYEIVKSRVLDVPIDGRDPLDVMLLDLSRKSRTRSGETLDYTSFYAYWFVGKNRETPYHSQRMLWMGTDRIFHNVSHRWAYIAVAGARNDERRYQEQLTGFLHELYPQILLE
ncbi:MAG: hypothetical protein A2X46_08870 [Lentisphaerae bacterium GWF2_57_35]|nr:MAG: hypothetical protein A2X46_08870 [Lentisphaerae bacterium GWF2_57_35]